MEEDKFNKIRQKIRSSYEQTIKHKKSRQIVLIEDKCIFPKKCDKLSEIVSKIENHFLSNILGEDYQKYTRSLKGLDMTTLKELSNKYDVDLGRLHGYRKYICDTVDPYISSIIERAYSLY